MCIYPRLIKNRKYTPNNKNGGIVPPLLDNRVKAVPVGCGRCMECRKQEARKWQIRLMEDIRENTNGIMIALTFSNEELKKIIKGDKEKGIKGIDTEMYKGYELDNEIARVSIKRFRERWRKEYGKSIRHWFITELGHQGTENIHMHGIVWTDKDVKEITKHWKYGFVWTGQYVNEKTVNYNIKYVHKIDKDHEEYKPIVLTSAGIGSGYMKRRDSERNKYKKGETKEYYTTRTGHKIAMPIYWRNKIYTEEEREKLWIEKLDKKERWVDGIKVDISNGEEEYYKLLKEARWKNRQLGYQDDVINWNKKKYEEERRTMLQQKRINPPEAGDCPPEGREHDNSIKPSKEW